MSAGAVLGGVCTHWEGPGVLWQADGAICARFASRSQWQAVALTCLSPCCSLDATSRSSTAFKLIFPIVLSPKHEVSRVKPICFDPALLVKLSWGSKFVLSLHFFNRHGACNVLEWTHRRSKKCVVKSFFFAFRCLSNQLKGMSSNLPVIPC